MVLYNRMLAGDIFPGRRRRIERRMGGREREVLEDLRVENAEFLSEHPADEFIREIVVGMESRGVAVTGDAAPVNSILSPVRGHPFGYRIRAFFASRTAMIAIPAACALLVLLTVFGPRQDEEPGVRSKGYGPAIVLYKQSEGGAELLQNNATVLPGDTVQLAYHAGRMEQGVILSIDGNGVVTRHFPREGEFSAHLEDENLVLMPYAYRLDEAPDFERFYFVASAEKFPLGGIIDSVRDSIASETGDISLPDGYTVYTILLKKGTQQ